MGQVAFQYLIGSARKALDSLGLRSMNTAEAYRPGYADVESWGLELRRRLDGRLDLFHGVFLDKIRGSSFLPSSYFLQRLDPILRDLLPKGDPVRAFSLGIMNLLEDFGMRAFPAAMRESPESIMLRVVVPAGQADPGRAGEAFGFWFAPALRRYPRIFGYPEFEASEISERRIRGAALLQIRLDWKPPESEPENPLAILIDELAPREAVPPTARQQKDAARPLRIRYHVASQSLYADDVWVMRDTPARILRKLMEEYSRSGRRQFSYSEFKLDRGLFPDPACAYFETRLARVMKRLNDRFPGISLRRLSRGRVCLEVTGSVQFVET